jgi:hypothetical protein
VGRGQDEILARLGAVLGRALDTRNKKMPSPEKRSSQLKFAVFLFNPA